MPRQSASTGRRLEIRVTEDGSKVNLRVDLYEAGVFKQFWATRAKMPAFGELSDHELTSMTGRAVDAVLGQQLLF